MKGGDAIGGLVDPMPINPIPNGLRRPVKAISVLVLAGLLSACSTVQLSCPADHVVTANINGPDYAGLASQVVALLAPYIASGGVLGAKRLEAGPSQNDGTLTIKTLDFGTQSYSCGNANPPPPAPIPPALKGPEPDADVPDSGTMFHPSPLPMKIIKG